MAAPAGCGICWKPVLNTVLARTAIHIARDVARRLRDPQIVEHAAILARQQTAFPRSIHWLPYSVAQGYAGLALLSAYMDSCFPEEEWDLIGRDQLELAARHVETIPSPSAGLFSGLSGLAFVAWQLSRNGTRYRRLLLALDDRICTDAIEHAGRLLSGPSDGLTVGDFDAISGLAGIGVYLLCRSSTNEKAADALSTVLTALVQMILERGEVPLWHTPAHLLWDEGMKRVYPFGNLNCGLAHGIPGPLALLSLSLREGIRVPGIRNAVDQTANWLSQHRCDDEWGANWSTAVPIQQVDKGEGLALQTGRSVDAPDGPGRSAWCYGSPGVARALWLAGRASDSERICALALSSMHATCRRPIAARRIDSPTFCHGVAGLLSITLRFVHETGDPVLLTESQALAQQIMDRYAPDSPLGFRNIETADHEIDQPGLLDGAPGVALALLAAATDVQPSWDRMFLLS